MTTTTTTTAALAEVAAAAAAAAAATGQQGTHVKSGARGNPDRNDGQGRVLM
jgi:hypothetical protein